MVRAHAVVASLTLAGCPGPDVSLGDADSDSGSTSGAADNGDAPTASESMSSAGTTAPADDGSGDGSGDDTTSSADPDTGGSTDTTAATTGDGTGDESTGEPPADATVVFVNFEGPSMSEGPDDSVSDTTSISPMAMDLGVFGGGPEQAAIVAAVQEDFAGLNVFVTAQRPDEGEYAMVVVTPTNPFGGVAAIAPLDCDDANANSVAFVFASKGDGASIDNIAGRISREVGTTMGLEHVDAPDDLLNIGQIFDDSSFTDSCEALSMAPQCAAQHAAQCPAGQQNSFAELLSMAGPA